MNRITEKDLQNLCDRLNDEYGYEREPYSETNLYGEVAYKANPRTYLISHQYGGVALHQMAKSGTGESDISGMGHVTKRELHTFLRGMLAASYAA